MNTFYDVTASAAALTAHTIGFSPVKTLCFVKGRRGFFSLKESFFFFIKRFMVIEKEKEI